MARLSHVILVLWGVLTCALTLAVYVGQVEVRAVQSQLRVLERLNRTVLLYCENVQRVNDLCEHQLDSVLDQLGVSGPDTWAARAKARKAMGGPAPGQPELGEVDARQGREARGQR